MMVHQSRVLAGQAVESVETAMLLDFLGEAFGRSALAMFLIDDSQQIRCANPAASIMLSTDDLVGRSAVDFSVPQPDPQRELDAAALVGGGLDLLEREAEILSEAGRRLRVMMRVDAVTPPSGERSFLVQLRDVTTAIAQETARADSELRYQELDQQPARHERPDVRPRSPAAGRRW